LAFEGAALAALNPTRFFGQTAGDGVNLEGAV
jgi:hypothetical protein